MIKLTSKNNIPVWIRPDQVLSINRSVVDNTTRVAMSRGINFDVLEIPEQVLILIEADEDRIADKYKEPKVPIS